MQQYILETDLNIASKMLCKIHVSLCNIKGQSFVMFLILMYRSSFQGPQTRFLSLQNLYQQPPLHALTRPQTHANMTVRRDHHAYPRGTNPLIPTASPTSARATSTHSPSCGERCLCLRQLNTHYLDFIWGKFWPNTQCTTAYNKESVF